MTFKHSITSLGLLLAVGGQAPAAQSQVELAETGLNEWEATWSGVALRTYFVQWSLDLVNWDYAPVVEFGTGVHESSVSLEGTSKIYLRLVYADSTGATTLQEARDMDFDNDEIPNAFEVEVVGSDPLDGASMGGDSDSDGLSDGLELYHFGTLNQGPDDDTDGDGIDNDDEFAGSTDPGDADTDNDGIPDGVDSSPLSASTVALPSASSAIHLWAPSEP